MRNWRYAPVRIAFAKWHSRVEAQISRVKQCAGASLLTQKIVAQENEGVTVANLINLWSAFGKPVSVKNA